MKATPCILRVSQGSIKTVMKPVNLEVDDITITGQLYIPEVDFPAIVCICHGIPSGKPRDPSDGGYPALAERLYNEGFAVLIFNFRGCGDSGGNLDIAGWSRDLGAAIDFLSYQPEIKGHHVALLGFSGGAAVSIYNAAHDERVSSVVSCASPAEFDFKEAEHRQTIEHFHSIGAIRDAVFPPSIEEWFGGFKMVTPLKHIARIAPRPVMIVHGLKDETVNISHACRLYSLAGELKRLSILEDAGHRLRQNEDAVEIIIDWLKYLYTKPDPEADYIDPLSEAGL